MKLLPFKGFITELFQQHYPFEKKEGSFLPHQYNFHSDSGHKYNVDIYHHSDGAHVAFSQLSGKHDTHEKMDATGDQGHKAVKTLSTIHHIIKHHLDQHPHIKHIRFSADKSEPSRVRLYQHLTKRFAKKHTEEDDLDMHRFSIHRKDVK